jgi:hypothetical protein
VTNRTNAAAATTRPVAVPATTSKIRRESVTRPPTPP